MANILVINNRETSTNLIVYDLRQVGHYVEVISNETGNGYDIANLINFDVILIDCNTIDLNSLALIKKTKEEKSRTICIVIADSLYESDILEIFDVGGDDYLIKPYSSRILIARIHSHLKKVKFNEIDYRYGDLVINKRDKKILLQEKELKLTQKEYDLLEYLIFNADKVLDRKKILKKVWEISYDGRNRSVDVYVVRLRKHLMNSNVNISRAYGTGYMLEKNDVIK